MPDLRLIAGDLTDVVHLVDGDELVAQRLEVRLRTHLGEWPLDASKGLRWTEWLSQRVLPLDEMRNAIVLEAETTPGVARVTSVEVTRTGTSASVRIEGACDSGGPLRLAFQVGATDPYAAPGLLPGALA